MITAYTDLINLMHTSKLCLVKLKLLSLLLILQIKFFFFFVDIFAIEMDGRMVGNTSIT